MVSRERYVFDSNVLVSAMLFEASTPGLAFCEALERGTLLISQPVLIELSTVLARKKFDHYVSRGDRDRFLSALVRDATWVEVAETLSICRDPKDAKFLELAASGAATCIISGDDDLLEVKVFREIPIRTPDEFLKSLESQRD